MLQIGGLGLRAAILAPRLGGLRNLVGLRRMSGANAARHMPHPPTRAMLRQPLGNLQQVSPAHLCHPGRSTNLQSGGVGGVVGL